MTIFAKRSLEVKKLTAYQEELINNGRIVQIYLDEISSASIGMDLVTVLPSKFSKLTCQEIETMFLLSDLKQTRVYQDARQEGRQEGRQNEVKRLLLRLLSKRFGKLTDRQTLLISSLDFEELEELGEALLDFVSLVDLDNWLAEK